MKKISAILVLFLAIILYSCNSTDQKFVGAWKYYESYGSIFDNKPNDHTMDTLVINITKYPNTNKTYRFKGLGIDILLTQKDENTLVSLNSSVNKVYVKYDTKTGHISLIMGEEETIIFSKLE